MSRFEEQVMEGRGTGEYLNQKKQWRLTVASDRSLPAAERLSYRSLVKIRVQRTPNQGSEALSSTLQTKQTDARPHRTRRSTTAIKTSSPFPSSSSPHQKSMGASHDSRPVQRRHSLRSLTSRIYLLHSDCCQSPSRVAWLSRTIPPGFRKPAFRWVVLIDFDEGEVSEKGVHILMQLCYFISGVAATVLSVVARRMVL